LRCYKKLKPKKIGDAAEKFLVFFIVEKVRKAGIIRVHTRVRT